MSKVVRRPTTAGLAASPHSESVPVRPCHRLLRQRAQESRRQTDLVVVSKDMSALAIMPKVVAAPSTAGGELALLVVWIAC
jgi:hypothetical protein